MSQTTEPLKDVVSASRRSLRVPPRGKCERNPYSKPARIPKASELQPDDPPPLAPPELRPDQLTALWEALSRAGDDPPQDLATAIQALPPVGSLPSPWETWTLAWLFACRRRQLWAQELIRERLPKMVPPSPKLRRQLQPVEVLVPEWTDWLVQMEADLDYAYLIHRLTGEVLGVDVSADRRENPLFLYECVRDLKPDYGWTPTGRLLALHPNPLTMWFAIEELKGVGVLERFDFGLDEEEMEDVEAYRFSHDVLPHAAAAREFWEAWDDPIRRLWLAALVGDWLAAEELARRTGNAVLIEHTRGRATECRQQRLEFLVRGIGDQPAAITELAALNQVDESRAAEYLRRGLCGGGSGVQAALDFMDRDDPRWCAEAYSLLKEHHEPPPPKGFSRVAAAEYLARHGYRTEEAIELAASDEGSLPELALVAVEYAPHTALPLVRKALRAESDSTIRKMAAVLAILDVPWSRRELCAALEAIEAEGRKLWRTQALVAALAESVSPEAHEIAAAWQPRFDSQERRGAKYALRCEMEEMEDRVLRLRNRFAELEEPSDPEGALASQTASEGS